MYMPSLFKDSLFDDFMNDVMFPTVNKAGYTRNVSNTMRTDIKESDGGYTLEIDLPGYKKEDVSAELKDGYLVITATTKTENDNNDGERYLRRERFFGTCSRTFYVGEDVTHEDIKAKFEDGILQVFIPKKEAQPKIEEKKVISID